MPPFIENNYFLKNLIDKINKAFTFENKGQALFLLDGIVINAAYMLTTGVILSGYLMYLGASDFLVALVNNSTNYSSIMCLFSYFILKRASNKKRLMLSMNFISRLLLFFIIIVPLIFKESNLTLAITVSMILVSDIIWAIYRVGWVVWIMDSTSEKSMSRYTYMRMLLSRIFMGISTIVGGIIVDYYEKGITGFIVVFTIAYILSVTDILILRKVKNVDDSSYQSSEPTLKGYFKPVKIKEYRYYLIFILLFYMIYTASISFSPVYLIKYLQLDYKFVSAASLIASFSLIISNRFWQKIETRTGITFVMGASAVFFIIELLLLTFLTKQTSLIFILSSIISGIGLGGFTVTIMTYRYNIMPQGGRIIYEGWFYFFYGLGMLLAPFVGEMFIQRVVDLEVNFIGLGQFQLLYLFSFVALSLLLFIYFIKPKIFKDL